MKKFNELYERIIMEVIEASKSSDDSELKYEDDYVIVPYQYCKKCKRLGYYKSEGCFGCKNIPDLSFGLTGFDELPRNEVTDDMVVDNERVDKDDFISNCIKQTKTKK